MVIVCSKIGQLGNRLTHMANLFANSMHYGYNIAYPYFDDYAQYFESFDKKNKIVLGQNRIRISFGKFSLEIICYLLNKLCNYLHKHPSKKLKLYRNYKEYWIDNYDLNDIEFQKDVQSKHVLLQGWLFRDYVHIEQYHDAICNLFTPKDWILSEVKKIMLAASEGGGAIVGVHIRRGDYKNYNDGIYYYVDEVYRKLMHEVSLLLNGRVTFIICSNEDININMFKGLDLLYDKRHFMVDLYTLASCDYIIGPPSSFTNWASYYGNVPLLKIFNSNQKVSLSDFEIRKKC